MTKSKTETAAAIDAATASSAHARINIPLNLDNWRAWPQNIQADLLWFHQHILDHRMGWDAVCDAIGYDRSNVFRVLKGTYTGNISNVCQAVRKYRKIAETRVGIQTNVPAENGISRMIGAGLEYALANNSITTIVGESRMGKSVAAEIWRQANNHGTSVLVVAPPYGGTRLFLRRIADAVGVNKNFSVAAIYEALQRAFNPNRMLIVDEAHRLLPGDRRCNPVSLDILRDLHDTTRCALALISTQRFDDELRKSHYQYEQILGRIGMPIRLPRRMRKADWMPILAQYINHPSAELCEHITHIANHQGRLGIMVEVLKVASRIANKAGEKLAEQHVYKSIALRRQMMGEHNR